jgi:alpha-L-rhamnosidase
MDCPQRDERLGWFGDAQVTAEEAMFNFDMAMHYKNWLRGIKANQDEATGDIPIISPRPYIKDEGVGWSSTYITIAWNYYIYYGDTQLLEENYDAMKRYLEFLGDISDDLIVPKGWIGDWGSHVKGWKEGEPTSVPTAFFYFNSTILAKVAKVLGKPEDEKHFTKLAEKIKKAYNKNYFNPETNDYNDGSQMANGFPIYLGLVPEGHERAVMENLVHDIEVNNDTHLTTGVLGTKYMIDALTIADRSDVAWALATQTTYPSWAEMMKRFNTMCEFWTLKQSHNHVMMGSIDAWFYKTLTGINLHEDKPAYEEFTIKPFLAEGLTFAKASTETFKGTISSEWNRSDNYFELSVSVPFNTSAIVYVPADKDTKINESLTTAAHAQDVNFIKYDNGYQLFEVASGDYTFFYKK